MAYTPVPNVDSGDFGRASWADIVKDDLADHETRIVAVEASGAGDVVGPASSVEKQLSLFDGATGKLLEGATGTGYVKVVSGVYQTPSATIPVADVTGAGDVTGQASSVDSEIALFSGTGGKTIKRATTTGVLKATSGVIAAAAAGTDYVSPTGTETLTNKTISDYTVVTGWRRIYVKVAFTDAQIKALPTTAVTLVAAPGAGIIVQPNKVLLLSKFSAGAYSNVDAGGWLVVQIGSDGWSNFVANITGSATPVWDPMYASDFFAAVDSRVVFREWIDTVDPSLQWGSLAPKFPMNSNGAVVLRMINGSSGNLTGGNAANSLTAYIEYDLVTVP